jgi:tetratricopeptide (TPR) repeat protein
MSVSRFVVCALLLCVSAAASAQAPSSSQAYYQFLLGRSLENQGEIDEAIKALRQAASLDPSSAEVLAELSALFARQDRAREALEAGHAALKLDPKNAEANRVLGFVYASLAGVDGGSGRLAGEAAVQAGKASAHLEAARRTDRMIDSSLEMTLARVYLRTGAAGKAIPALNRLLEAEPEQAEAVALLAEALEDDGRPGDAVSLLEGAVGTQPAFLPPLAELYERQERWEEAAAAYEKAVVQNPRSLDLKMRLSVALLSWGEAGRAGRALELMEQVREARPADPRVLYLVSQAQRNAGKLEAAEQTARVLMTVAPSLISGPYALAQILSDRQQPAEAIKVLQEARSRFPDDVSLSFEMGAIYEQQKRYADAERQFRDVIARDPLHAPALNYLGYMLAERGERLDEAIGLISRALQVEPDNGSYLDSLGWAYFKANRLDLAETNLRKAAAARLSSSTVQDHFGDLLFRLGRFGEAASAWERALAGDGDDVDGAAIQKKLQAARAKGKGGGR